jgi:hypothetical protein
MVPKPQHSDSLISKHVRSRSIASSTELIIMAATIQLDGQLCGSTIEIHYVTAERMLTAKFVFREISIPEMPPESALRVGCLFPQHASAVHERRI